MTFPDFDAEAQRMIQQAATEGALSRVSDPRCRVCRDEVICKTVNKLLARGDTLVDIISTLEAANRSLPQSDKVTYDSLYRHRKRHFDVQNPAWAIHRKIAERRYAEAGKDHEQGIGNMVNHLVFLESMMIKGYETMLEEETVITPKDGLAASLELDEIRRREEGSVDKAKMVAEMSRVINVVRQFVPVEQWPKLQAALSGESAPQAVASERGIEAVQMIPIMNDHDESFDG